MSVLPIDPPTITESKSNEATTGRKASLKCEASAVPAPDFEWYRDDTRFVPNLLCPPGSHSSARETGSPDETRTPAIITRPFQLDYSFSKAFYLVLWDCSSWTPAPKHTGYVHRVGSFHLHVFLAWNRNQSPVKLIHSRAVSISRLYSDTLGLRH